MAGSQYGIPVIVGEGRRPEVLAQVTLTGTKGSSYDEKWLQDLVFENAELLPVNQIDSSYEGLVPVCTELNTTSGPIDALYVTAKGRLVVVEAKLWRNHEARRKVVAQILDYAQALNGWSYESLLKEVCKRTKRSGNALWDIVRERTGAVDEQAFIDGVSRCLRASEFLLLIVGDGIREGAGAIANFLENAGRFNFTFGLVELAIFDLGDGRRLVLPRVLAQTVLIERPRYFASEFAGLSGSVDTSVDDSSDDGSARELTTREAACRDFWRDYLAQLKLDDQTQPYANSRSWSSIDFSGPPKSGAWITNRLGSVVSNRSEVVLTFLRGPVGDSIYSSLRDQKAEIEKELSPLSVRWDSRDGKHSVAAEHQFGGDALAPERRAEAFAFFSEATNKFVNAFRERIATILNQQTG